MMDTFDTPTMTVDAPPAALSDASAQAAHSPPVVDLSEQALDALIERIEQARTHNLALSADDYGLLLNAVLMLANMQERLSANDLSIHKLKKLLGMARSSEKLRDLVPDSADDQDGASTGSAHKGRSRSSARIPRNKRPKPPPIKPSVHRHAMAGMSKGDTCPSCLAGKVYKYDPAVLLRMIGHAPLSSERHLMDQLRCNGCGEIFSAELPEHVKADGPRDQHYGYSARSVMAINKYFAGSPFYRQESINGLLGGHVAASTIFDQCEQVANALNPILKAIKLIAANAALFYLDDTSNRILMQKPIIKTRAGKERLRSGIYTSAVLAITDQQQRIVLFQTNVGHAGEWMEEILSVRESGLAAPILMSDALSANQISGHSVEQCLCNAHGRRAFAELAEQHPAEVRDALKRYRHIWINETYCTEQGFSAEARCQYHQQHSLPHMEALRSWCQEQLDSAAVEPNSNLGKAMQYLLRHYEGLTAFCRIPGAVIDNNEIERLIKVIVRARKNSLFFKTLVGAEISDVITSILATCHEHNVNAFEYLNAVQRNQASVKATPERWLPWNYRGS